MGLHVVKYETDGFDAARLALAAEDTPLRVDGPRAIGTAFFSDVDAVIVEYVAPGTASSAPEYDDEYAEYADPFVSVVDALRRTYAENRWQGMLDGTKLGFGEVHISRRPEEVGFVAVWAADLFSTGRGKITRSSVEITYRQSQEGELIRKLGKTQMELTAELEALADTAGDARGLPHTRRTHRRTDDRRDQR